MSVQVRNHADRFSHDTAHIKTTTVPDNFTTILIILLHQTEREIMKIIILMLLGQFGASNEIIAKFMG